MHAAHISPSALSKCVKESREPFEETVIRHRVWCSLEEPNKRGMPTTKIQKLGKKIKKKKLIVETECSRCKNDGGKK